MGFMHKDEYEDYIIQQNANVISEEEITEMKQNLSPLIGKRSITCTFKNHLCSAIML